MLVTSSANNQQVVVTFVKGQRLEDRPRSGRPSTVSRVAKIVSSKAADKRDQSAWKLATRLSRKGCQLSKKTVQKYTKHSLGLTAGPNSCKITMFVDLRIFEQNWKNEGEVINR